MGIGAVLEHDSHAIAYASCVLTPSECNYSMIQRECLALCMLSSSSDTVYSDALLSCLPTMPRYNGCPLRNGKYACLLDISHAGVHLYHTILERCKENGNADSLCRRSLVNNHNRGMTPLSPQFGTP